MQCHAAFFIRPGFGLDQSGFVDSASNPNPDFHKKNPGNRKMAISDVASSTRTRVHTKQYASSFCLIAPCISSLFQVSTHIDEKCGLTNNSAEIKGLSSYIPLDFHQNRVALERSQPDFPEHVKSLSMFLNKNTFLQFFHLCKIIQST